MPASANKSDGPTPSGTHSTSSSTSTISSLTLEPGANGSVDLSDDHVETTPTELAKISTVTKTPIVTADAQEVKHTVTEAHEKVAALTSVTTKMAISKTTFDRETTGKASVHETDFPATQPCPTHADEDAEKTQYLRDLYIKQYGDIFDVRQYGDLDEELAINAVYGDIMKCEGQAWNSSFWKDPRGWN